MHLTDQAVLIPGLMQDTVIDFAGSAPDVVPYSNVRLQSKVKPGTVHGCFVEPGGTRGVSCKSIATRPEHFGLFSRLGNLRGDIGTGGLTAVATHRLFPKFVAASGSGAGQVTISGKLHIYVELECDSAKTSSFLARKPEARQPDAAFLRAHSTIAFAEFDLTSPTPRMTARRGVVPLWTGEAEWYSFGREISAKVEDHTARSRHGWLHIDTGQQIDVKFGGDAASARFLHLSLVDTIFTSNVKQMVSYMHIRDLYRLKQVVIQVVS